MRARSAMARTVALVCALVAGCASTRATTAPMTARTLPGGPQLVGQASSEGKPFTGHPVSLDFQGVDLRAVLRTFADITGLNIVIDPQVQGNVDVVAARRAVGSGARHHPAREPARIQRRRQHRPHRAAEGAGRGGTGAPQADRGEGALGRAAPDDAHAQLRPRQGRRAAGDAVGAVAARHRAGGRAQQHAHHHRPRRPARGRQLRCSIRSIAPSRRSKSRRASCSPAAASPARSACSGAFSAPSRSSLATPPASPSRTAARSAAASAATGTRPVRR